MKMDLVYTHQTSQAHVGQGALLHGLIRNFLELREFRGLHANKMAYYLESLNELRRISYLSMSMPLLREKEIPSIVDFDEPISCANVNDHNKGISEIYYSEPLATSSALVFTLSSEKSQM